MTRPLLEPVPVAVHPALELRRTGNVKSIQERSGSQLDGTHGVPLLDCGLERTYIAG
jgi:hypothetical protein